MKNFYLVRAFREWHEVDDLTKANAIFDTLVADGHTYVELSKVQLDGSWYSESIKIFCK